MPPRKKKEQTKQKKKKIRQGPVRIPYEDGPEDFSVALPKRPLTRSQLARAEFDAMMMQQSTAMAMDTPGVPADVLSAAVNELRSARSSARPAASSSSSAASVPGPSGKEAVFAFGSATTEMRRQTRRVHEDLSERSDKVRKEAAGPAPMDFSVMSRTGRRGVRRAPAPVPAPAPAPVDQAGAAATTAAGPDLTENGGESGGDGDLDAEVDRSLDEVLQSAEEPAPVADAVENETVTVQTGGGGFVADMPADQAVLGNDLTWGPAIGTKRARGIQFRTTDYFVSGTDISAPAEKIRRRPKPDPNRPSLVTLAARHERSRESAHKRPDSVFDRTGTVSNVEARSAERATIRKEARMAALTAARKSRWDRRD